MSPREAVIDLDLLPPEEPTAPSRPRVSRRHVLSAAVLVVALLIPAGAAPPAPVRSPVRTVWIAAEANYEPVGDTLYVTEGSDPRPRFAAYPLSGGPARWSTPLPLPAGNLFAEEAGDAVVVSMGVDEPGQDSTVALDRSTGKVLWQSRLPVTALDPDGKRVLLGQIRPTVDVGSASAGDVVAVDPRTGKQVWAYHRERACLGDLLWRYSGMVVLCADGVMRVLDLDSGKIRRTAVHPQLATAASSGWGLRLAASTDLIVVMYAEQGRIVVDGFDPTGLAGKWTATLPLSSYEVYDCGPLACLFSPDAVIAVERNTGRVRWRVEPGGDTFPFGDRYLVAQPSTEHPKLIDSATGRTVLNLSGWLTAYSYETVDPVFFHPDPARNRMWLAVVDPGQRALRVLGSVPQTDGLTVDCATAGGYVVCRTVKDAVQVWRIGVP